MSDMRDENILGVWRDGPDYTIISRASRAEWQLAFRRVSAEVPDALAKHLFELPRYLRDEVHVIISTLSGTSLASAYYDRVIAPLLQALKVVHRPLYTTSRESIIQFAGKLSGTVILLSGDGGINDLINGAQCRLTVALFPLGSGNAIYHSYMQDGLFSLLRGTPSPLPVFRATFARATLHGEPIHTILGAVVASYGFHPALIAEAEKYRAMGPARFRRVAEDLLRNPQTYPGRVNGDSMRGYAAAVMVRKLDDRFCISPANEFRLIHTDTSELMKGYSEGLNACKVDRVEIDADGIFCVDGLIIDVQGLVIVEEVKSVLDLVVY